MTVEAQQITAVRHLTVEESFFDHFDRASDTIPGLELESGEVLFLSADEEGNEPGVWPVSESQLSEYVGWYVAGFAERSGPGRGRELALKLTDTEPIEYPIRPPSTGPVVSYEDKAGDTKWLVWPDTVQMVNIWPDPSHGIGPATWMVRIPVDDETRPDPATTPTPMEVIEQRANGTIDRDEYQQLLRKAERAHTGALFESIL